jgi:hypothetical protein
MLFHPSLMFVSRARSLPKGGELENTFAIVISITSGVVTVSYLHPSLVFAFTVGSLTLKFVRYPTRVGSGLARKY